MVQCDDILGSYGVIRGSTVAIAPDSILLSSSLTGAVVDPALAIGVVLLNGVSGGIVEVSVWDGPMALELSVLPLASRSS